MKNQFNVVNSKEITTLTIEKAMIKLSAYYISYKRTNARPNVIQWHIGNKKGELVF